MTGAVDHMEDLAWDKPEEMDLAVTMVDMVGSGVAGGDMEGLPDLGGLVLQEALGEEEEWGLLGEWTVEQEDLVEVEVGALRLEMEEALVGEA